jgi:hypothetical protein
MADRTQELTLLLKAKIAGQGALDTMSLGLDKVAEKARGVGEDLGRMGSSLGAGLGNLTENLLTGQDFGTAATNLGAFMAGEMVQEFSGDLATKLGSSTLIAGLAAPLASIGAGIGGLISAAIPIGMALLPVILIGAIIAAIAVLIFNEDIRNKVFAFIGGVIGNIGKALSGLGATLLDLVGKGITFIATNIGPFVGGLVKAIIDGLISLPGKIADVIRSAFASIKIDIGPFHIRPTGVTIDLPKFETGPATGAAAAHPLPHSQGGGWVGLHGPEIRVVGEAGPEYVVPNHALGGRGGPTVVNIHIAGQHVASVLLPLLSGELAGEFDTAAATMAGV